MRRGPLYMLLATMSFTVMVALVKVARQELSALEVMGWRAAVSVPLAYLLARRSGLGITNRRLLVVRILLGFGAMGCFYTAAKGLLLSDLAIISKLQPILVALAAPLVLGARERSGWMVWLTLAAGICGSTLVLGPKLAVGNTFGLWALAAAVLSGAAHLSIRALGRTEAPEPIVLWFQVGVLVLASGAVLATRGGIPLPGPHLWAPLVGCGVAATAGQMLLTRAYAAERASLVAAASYTSPVWGVALDLALFAKWPTGHAVAGGVLIVAAGLALVFHGARRDGPIAGEPVDYSSTIER